MKWLNWEHPNCRCVVLKEEPMNILILDRKPALAARYHCDRDVSRHLLDTVQALYLAHYFHDGQQAAASRVAWAPSLLDTRHPCARWVQENSANYNWTLGLFHGLLAEYARRQYVPHSYGNLYTPLARLPDNIRRTTELTPFHIGLPPKYCDTKDPVRAYRLWYFLEKKDPTWSLPAEKPQWWKDLADSQCTREEVCR